MNSISCYIRFILAVLLSDYLAIYLSIDIFISYKYQSDFPLQIHQFPLQSSPNHNSPNTQPNHSKQTDHKSQSFTLSNPTPKHITNPSQLEASQERKLCAQEQEESSLALVYLLVTPRAKDLRTPAQYKFTL
jgi:hypothetical protein